MSNIQAVNADGVHELMLIGTALKNGRAAIEEQTEYSSRDMQIDEAIVIIDRIIGEGFAAV